MTKTENHRTGRVRGEEFEVDLGPIHKMYLVIGAPVKRDPGGRRLSAAAVLFKKSAACEQDSGVGLVRFFGEDLPKPGLAHSDFTRAWRQQKHVDTDTDTHSIMWTNDPFHELLHSVMTEKSECLAETILGYWYVAHHYNAKTEDVASWSQTVTNRIIELDYQGDDTVPPRDLFRVVYSAAIHGGVCEPNVIAMGNRLIEKGYAKVEESIRWKTACGQKVNIS